MSSQEFQVGISIIEALDSPYILPGSPRKPYISPMSRPPDNSQPENSLNVR